VIAYPIELTKVSAVPRPSAGADLATSVENKGESAMTITPQKIRKIRKKTSEANNNSKGDMRQHIPEKINAVLATRATPNLSDKIPLIAQATAPEPIMRKLQRGIFEILSGWK
tara:strand:+ start:140 stop:478 length:339 start_codon:yes stop_codon:yes gene_type:complete